VRVLGALKCGLVAFFIVGMGETRTEAQVANPADAAASESAETRRRAVEEPPPPTARELELERRVAELERATGSQRRQSDAAPPAGAERPISDQDIDGAKPRLRSWELPAVNVVGEGSGLREEDRVGSYGQPRWTATRRFPGTRVYVIPEGKVEIEYWLRPTLADDGGPTEIRSLYEVEIGLPHRFQLDLYLRTDQDSNESEQLLGSQVEIRYALADWGKIWGNPTLYAEWVGLEQRPDKLELKLLLGDELAPRWHWGINLVGEFETGGEREYEYQFTGGLSYTVVDEKFSVGAELQALYADVKGDRGDFSQAYYFGPSFQYRPMPAFTINFAPLVGIGPDAGDARFFLNLGYEF
jgi:hypothetical protein